MKTSNGGAVAGGRPAPLPNPARLLEEPLPGALLGLPVYANVYARNGFRFLATPASVDRKRTEQEAQRVRNLCKSSRAAVDKLSVRTGYDEFAPVDDPKACVNLLSDPKQRLLAELFWPHLSDDGFAPVKRAKSLVEPSTVAEVEAASRGATARDGVLRRHALAVLRHNQAIGHELRVGLGQEEWTPRYWEAALAGWAATFRDERFWDYMLDRVAGFDDPRLPVEDAPVIRTQAPTAVLGFNALFARIYAQNGATDLCQKHLGLIGRSGFPDDARAAVLAPTAKVLVGGRVAGLVSRVKTELRAGTDRYTRADFERQARPILEAVEAEGRYLREEMGMSRPGDGLDEFDDVAAEFVSALNRINYDTGDENRERALLYSLLVTRRLLELPVSPQKRRDLEASARKDVGYLYPEADSNSNELDPTRCYFLGGEPADPEASFVLPVYKITDTSGDSVKWTHQRVLVPRSDLARRYHAGRVTPAELAALGNDDPVCRSLREQAEAARKEGRRAAAETQAKLDAETARPDLTTPRHAAAIERSRHEAGAAVQRIQSESEREAEQVKQRYRRQWETYHGGVAAQEAADQQFLKTLDAKLRRGRAQEDERCRAGQDEAQARFAGPIEQAEDSLSRWKADHEGFASLIRLEIPWALGAGIVVVNLLWLAAQVMNTPALRSPVPLLAAMATGCTAGWSIAWSKRSVRLNEASRPLQVLREALSRELKGLDETRAERVAAFEKKAKDLAAPARERLRAVEQTREQLMKEGKDELNRLRERVTRRVEDVRKTSEREIHDLQSKINAHEAERNATLRKLRDEKARIEREAESKAAGFEAQAAARVKPRPESDKKTFPAFRKALNRGFREGTRPSQSEIDEISRREFDDFMKSLTDFEKNLLATAMRVDGEAGFNRMLSLLMSQKRGRSLD